MRGMTGPHIPVPLAENAGVAFPGAGVPGGCVVERPIAERMLAARNRHGKPNADVLRPYADPGDFRAGPRGRWVVDFPADLTQEEASLYGEPWKLFSASGGRLHERADPLRIAIARMGSFLAAPAARVPRGFLPMEAPTLPGAGLVVAASEDDFVCAVLQSGVFAAWVGAHGGRLRVRHVASFPFPWAPHAEFNSLSRVQVELRDAVNHAPVDNLDAAVAAAYGWKAALDEDEFVARLRALNVSRTTAN